MRTSSLGRRGARSLTTLTALGAIAGLACTAVGQQSFSNALSFDDVDDQVTCAGNFDVTSLTIEAWIFVRDYGPAGYGGIVAWGRQQDASYELGVLGLNGVPQILFTLNLGKAGYTAVVKSNLYQLNTWCHIAVTYNGSFMNFYRNGVFVDSQVVTVPIQPAGNGAVFAINNLLTGNDQHSDVMYDDIRIWNVALSEDEIRCNLSRPISGVPAGLIAYYKFDETSGQTCIDSSGNGRTGVLGTTSAAEAGDPQRVASNVESHCFDVVNQPQSVTYCRGGTVKLEYEVCGVDPLVFQWRFNGEDIAGATESTYTITNLDDAQSGVYDAVATSPCGQVTSIQASVDVCSADFDCTGFVDLEDFSAFVVAFEAGGDDADFDESGFVDLDDFAAFVGAFETGC
ncbi:MAG: hypothetical protein IT435_06510 [Phycisphaerales bacterium]|nr:hypothetical protein [Phycisphaerales bacterium]